ncbi:MAG: type II toxin-antitoxin system HicA family toxin [Planctomycetaceae bacterium]|nr:type II toxin-antitoxin system HicA family toxin [Planctomycetaceae bacterium]MCB9949481.1 type II toxin-antitoxin system HicA family toxin [Planctomycetaceae bacterium]
MSSRLPPVSSRDVIRVLQRYGFRLIKGRGKGSHVFMYRDDPPTGITIPERRELASGTLRNILRQAGISQQEFLELLKG